MTILQSKIKNRQSKIACQVGWNRPGPSGVPTIMVGYGCGAQKGISYGIHATYA